MPSCSFSHPSYCCSSSATFPILPCRIFLLFIFCLLVALSLFVGSVWTLTLTKLLHTFLPHACMHVLGLVSPRVSVSFPNRRRHATFLCRCFLIAFLSLAPLVALGFAARSHCRLPAGTLSAHASLAFARPPSCNVLNVREKDTRLHRKTPIANRTRRRDSARLPFEGGDLVGAFANRLARNKVESYAALCARDS